MHNLELGDLQSPLMQWITQSVPCGLGAFEATGKDVGLCKNYVGTMGCDFSVLGRV